MSIFFSLSYTAYCIDRLASDAALVALTAGIGMPDYVFQMNLNQNKSPYATDIEA